ncbi:hypothetical protein MMC11_006497 [Xylographa trunciseda]|nr:hypothetical protein [Xylographa trunciseda]
MDATIQEAWRSAQRLEKQLHVSVVDIRADQHEINQQLVEYRAKCDNVIFLHFDFSQDRNIELRLWDTHGKVNSYYRKQLTYFRNGGGKRRVVEQRKLMKNYLEFIKASQRYYRSYIRKLASHFGGIPEVDAIARKLNMAAHESYMKGAALIFLTAPIGGEIAMLSHDLRQQILFSCHQSLIRLGDLSRYRETELATKERNWGPAIGYYDLAGAIRPSSGASHNQLAVIALADGNHLRSTYHLYRALAVDEPHPTAKGNLEIGFRKIVVAQEKGELLHDNAQNDHSTSAKALLGWFMLLHAQCYKGLDFIGHEELENEVVSQLAIELKERSLEGILQKIVLVNIAAEYFASVRLQSQPESLALRQAYLYFLRLNVKTMFTLLQVLQPELECFATESSSDPETTVKRSEKITAVARRVLPGLRQYSSWLICTSAILIAQVGDTTLDVQVKELWKTYANTLTLLAATFSASDLPTIEYLLEEDEDTLGFKPFEYEQLLKRYNDQETGALKPMFHAADVKRQHPNVEMLGRIHDFLVDGLSLSKDESIPIERLAGTTTFAYREEGMLSELMASPQGHHATISSTSIDREDISLAKEASANAPKSVVNDEASQSASVSVTANLVMNEMVDNIVGSEATNESECRDYYASPIRAPPTPPSYSFDESPIKSCGNDTSYGVFGTSTLQGFLNDPNFNTPHQPSHKGTPRPLLPSIYNTVFAPTPDEVSSRPSTAKGLSPTRLSLQPQANEYLVESSMSSMHAPSSMFPDQTPHFVVANSYCLPQETTGAHGSALGSTMSLAQTDPYHNGAYGAAS